MFAFALRRALWAIPTLVGVSLVVFVLTTLMPEPSVADGLVSPNAAVRLDEMRRSRFLDLPRFFNPAPRDVRVRIEECINHIVRNTQDSALCSHRLSQIGGAGLPFILPQLSRLPVEERSKIIEALAPLARRMAFEAGKLSPDSATSLKFWTHFWDDHSVDFTGPAVRREVDRLVRRGSDKREADIRVLDTFALEAILSYMHEDTPRESLVRLSRLASHVTGRDSVISESDDVAHTRVVISDWKSWWYVHESDFTVLQGGPKVAASIGQTRFAKWVLGAATGQLGLSARDHQPIVDKLIAKAPHTLTIALFGLLASITLAIPLGVVAAWSHGRTIDQITSALLLVFYGLPTFLVAQLLTSLNRGTSDHGLWPAAALATVSLSVMTRQQRASMIEVLAQDYIRAARAKGARTLRVTVIHALRNSLIPLVTVAGVQFPALVGATFVIEEVFGIQAMGWETLRAIESHDAPWVVAVTLLCAAVTTAFLVASDVITSLLDPRIRERQVQRAFRS